MCMFSAKHWQNCATCQLWTGPREFNIERAAVHVEPDAMGACVRNATQSKYATSSCIAWRHWAMLDEPMAIAPLGGLPAVAGLSV